MRVFLNFIFARYRCLSPRTPILVAPIRGASKNQERKIPDLIHFSLFRRCKRDRAAPYSAMLVQVVRRGGFVRGVEIRCKCRSHVINY